MPIETDLAFGQIHFSQPGFLTCLDNVGKSEHGQFLSFVMRKTFFTIFSNWPGDAGGLQLLSPIISSTAVQDDQR